MQPLFTSPVSLPEAFVQRMQATLPQHFPAFLEAHQQEAPVSVRGHWLRRASVPNVFEKVPWTSSGIYLASRPVFALDPYWHAGAYYVQEASSMFLEQAWNAIAKELEDSVVALDLCAAPGGKSTHLSSLLPEGSLLVSNEVIRLRAQILAENVTKWGLGNVIVTNSDPQHFNNLTDFFDVILIDAPCSGEGMFRKDPTAVQEWSESNVALCAERQCRIVADVWNALKPGGFLIYSTCTYNAAENEETLQWLSATYEAEGVALEIDDSWGIETIETASGLTGYRFYPHRLKGEGLFMAVLRKPDAHVRTLRKPAKITWQKATRKETDIVKDWLQTPEQWDWLRWQDKLLVLPLQTHLLAEQLASQLRIVYAGVEVAELVRTQANPLPPLAFCTHINTEAFASESLTLEQALRYLRKDELTLEPGTGWKRMQYQDASLGWLKQIGHRANNYFPNEWRLRMDWKEIEKRLATEMTTWLPPTKKED